MGVVHGLHAFLPRLLAQDRPAHIVNTASMAGLVPAAGLGAYSATKAAVVGLTEALDIELRGTRIRVSALCPGVIDTAIVATSTMRGEWADRRARTADLYARRGTSPERRRPAGAGRGDARPQDRADPTAPSRAALGAQARASARGPRDVGGDLPVPEAEPLMPRGARFKSLMRAACGRGQREVRAERHMLLSWKP